MLWWVEREENGGKMGNRCKGVGVCCVGGGGGGVGHCVTMFCYCGLWLVV